MATAEARQTADSIQNVLSERDILGMATIAVSTSGGVLFAERIANRVLPMIGMPTTPSTMMEALASAGIKGSVALVGGVAAAQTSGLPMVVGAFLAVGALTAAGVDLIGVFFDVPELRALQNIGRTSNRSRVSGRTRPKQRVTPRQPAQREEEEEITFRQANGRQSVDTEEEIEFRGAPA